MTGMLRVMCGGMMTVLAVWPFSATADLARNGQTEYVVVQAENATAPEKWAVQELTNFLGRVTGASYPVVAESSLPGSTRAIYVGHTAFAARHGIDPAALGEEEWVIRSIGDDLILAGGRPRGTMYAVYEFLERQVGCHWLDPLTEIVPDRPTLPLATLDIRSKPRFVFRELQSPTGCWGEWLPPEGSASAESRARSYDAMWAFLVRNKTYRHTFDYSRPEVFPRDAFYQLRGSLWGHSFHACVSATDWFATHPEYFSLNARGERLPARDGAGPGQLCTTHPDVRRLTIEAVKAHIARDRDRAAQQGCPPPRYYMVGQEDVYDAHCRCPACQAIAEREGGESGPLLDFVNAVADAIGREYPDVVIATMAYLQTARPPRTLRTRPNVLIQWCNMHGDTLRPLEHPYNAANNAALGGWSAVTPRLAVWDYWTLWSGQHQFPLPCTKVPNIAPDMRRLAACGAEWFYAESPDYMAAGEHFTALKFWLGYQLMVDPDRPDEPLIQTFMDGYYGRAAPQMAAYLAYLRERIDRDAEHYLASVAPRRLRYLDVEFFRVAQALFDEAESRVAPDSPAAWHVRRERFILDGALLQLWAKLDRTLPADTTLPFDHDALIRRYEVNGREHIRRHFSWFYSGKKGEGGRLEKLVALFRNPNLPEPFRRLPPRDVADFTWLHWPNFDNWVYPTERRFVDDPDAAGGMALLFDGYAGPVTAAATKGPAVTFAPGELIGDGRYHCYPIGRVTVRPDGEVFSSWGSPPVAQGTGISALDGRFRVCVDELAAPDGGQAGADDWDAWVSMKVQGPAHVPGSTATNAVWLDRVILVKPQEKR